MKSERFEKPLRADISADRVRVNLVKSETAERKTQKSAGSFAPVPLSPVLTTEPISDFAATMERVKAKKTGDSEDNSIFSPAKHHMAGESFGVFLAREEHEALRMRSVIREWKNEELVNRWILCQLENGIDVGDAR
jgi:hypothetical protein